MKRLERVAIAIIIVLVVVVTTIAVVDILTPPRSGRSTTSLPFVVQPVVDVIVPALFNDQGSKNLNAPLNATGGQSITLSVSIYATIALNCKMEYQIFSLLGANSSNSTTSATSPLTSISFSPEILSIESGGKGTTNMTIIFSSSAIPGEYNSVLSAVNLDNSSQTWGDLIQVIVS